MAQRRVSNRYNTNVRRSFDGDPATARKTAIRKAFADLGPVVYFIKDADLIKIGHSGNLKNRRRAFTSNLDAILAVIPGDLALEQQMHERFASARAHRQEWYRPVPELVAYINGVRERMNVPPVAI
ncbi:GIY-YIG nuclease family protein [Actinomadura litoris]|uniref:GIY-YIG nuclease family protein n=1 Tax=Actinomadura litoris TaxID=2678616 RepID=UPI001FA72DFE|nr:GIY-YIG nuclease family protein [Actinomadura litoris]